MNTVLSTWQAMQAHQLYLPFAWFFSGLTNVLIALPSFWALGRWLGRSRAVLLIVTLSLFAFLIEGQALLTGWPYGGFYYSSFIGYKLFGLVPWTLPFSYVPLVLGSAVISYRFSSHWLMRILLIGVILMMIDLAFDPLASRLGFWVWNNPVGFYGVPWSNFVGWFISGVLAGGIFVGFNRRINSSPPWALASSLTLFLIGTTIGNLVLGFWIPMLIGLGVLVLLWYSYRNAQIQQKSKINLS